MKLAPPSSPSPPDTCGTSDVCGRAGFALAAWLVPILLLASLTNAPGEMVGVDQARTAVIGWLRADPSPMETAMGQQVKQVETFGDAAGNPLYYVAYLDPDGFVIVSADDLVEPIIGFAPGGRFDPAADNPLGALVSRDIPGRIAAAKGAWGGAATAWQSAARQKWGQLRRLAEAASGVEQGLSSVSDVRVAPLTQTLWDQTTAGGNACYNYYTPPNGDGSSANYPCGCVATAMAQLMRFWQYPGFGVGTPSFSITVDGVGQTAYLRGGDGVGGAYVWSNMVTNPASSSTLAQRQAIGALCYDAGVSVNMSYGSGGSAADTLQAKDVLISTFGYANAVKGYNGSATIGAGLNGMVNPNLDAGCPVLFGITDGYSGHAIVCDGYGYELSTLYHHLNLGWSGSYTAWYNLPNIDTGYSFNSVYKCIYNVWTSGSGEIISGRITDGSGTPVSGVLVTAQRSGGGTYTATTDAKGIYALARIPASSTYTLSPTKTGFAFTNRTVSTGLSGDYAATAGNQWAIDFAQTDTNNPSSFTAAPVSRSRIDLSWVKDPAGDNVMVAWNSSATFGTPTGAYAVGDPIPGGGTVLYNGSGTSVSHTGLSGGTRYYYRAWSVKSGPSYSSGVSCAATTIRGVPFTEGFENAGLIPDDWTQEYVIAMANWAFQSGGHLSHPASAHGGSYNALLYYGAASDHKTKLVTPMLDFGASPLNPRLTFWHYMELWSPDQDELRVYYKTSPTGSWNLLATYTANVSSWTQRTLSLPGANSTYYIAFEGNAKYGFGVCIDDVAVAVDAPQVTQFGWSSIASTQYVAAPFPVTITAQDANGDTVTGFTGTVNLSGRATISLATNRILGSVTHTYADIGDYTLGYSFTPNTNITVTDVRHYFGTKVSLWTEAGALLASRSVSSVPGTWVETPLNSPVELLAGHRYVVGVYSGGSANNWYCRYDGGTSFPNGTIDGSWWMDGDGFPSYGDTLETRYFVDLKYTVGSTVPVAVTPTTTSNFVNGEWNGSVAVLAAAASASLHADDGSGHSGDSGSFKVLSAAVPNFTAAPTSGIAPLNVYFTNLSGGATSYSWSFGDGTFSAAQNPVHTYTNAGLYTVSLSAIGLDSTNTLVRTNYIVVTNFVPQLARFAWALIAPTQYAAAPFAVTLTAQDTNGFTVTSFSGPVNLSARASGGLITNRILGSVTHAYAEPGDYTLGYSFTPNTNITVTDVRHYFGTKVSLWTQAGALLASRSVSSVPGTWVETPLSSPVELLAGHRYVVGVYSGGSANNWYCRYDGGTSFPNGTIDGSWWMDGDGFPSYGDTLETRYFVDLKYTVGATAPVAVTPTTTSNFVNGAWSGWLVLPSPATNVYLRADDGNGHSGECGPINVISGVIPVLTWQYNAQAGTLQISWEGTGGRLQGQTNSRSVGITTNWYDVPGGATRPVVITVNRTNPVVMYRLVWP